MGVSLVMIFWQLHLQDEVQLHSFDAAHESEHQEGPDVICYLCGVAASIFYFPPQQGETECPGKGERSVNSLTSAPVSP